MSNAPGSRCQCLTLDLRQERADLSTELPSANDDAPSASPRGCAVVVANV
jgi:hypothetical protein